MLQWEPYQNLELGLRLRRSEKSRFQRRIDSTNGRLPAQAKKAIERLWNRLNEMEMEICGIWTVCRRELTSGLLQELDLSEPMSRSLVAVEETKSKNNNVSCLKHVQLRRI